MQYQIIGDEFPVVSCTLNANETLITEGGAMCWMTPNMKMETTSNGGIGKVFGRMFSGESLFQNRYTAIGGVGMLTFASSFPGCIRVFDITPGRDIIVQRRAFLASEPTVELSAYVVKKASVAIAGGEGIVMQRLSGQGKAFVEFDGYVVEYELQPGQQLVVDNGGYLAAMDSTCQIQVQQVPGVKNAFLGGEGFFNTVITGPGKVYLQTMPIRSIANAIRPYIPTSG